MRKSAGAGLAVVAMLAGAARADDASPAPAQIARLRTDNSAIVVQDKDTAGVFEVQDDGTIKHRQSGLICPARYPNAAFFHALVYDAGKGLDVGCDYKRPDDKGGANAKLTIFVTKVADGASVDAEFAKRRAEVAQTYPEAKSQGPALTITQESKAALPDVRTEEFLIWMNERDYTTQLIVAVSKGWSIEIRATFSGKPNEIALNAGSTTQDAADAGGDRVMGAKALFDALGTVGK